MANCLVISSYLCQGAIGLTATGAALRAMGHEVVAIPTVFYSCHPGHKRFAGKAVPARQLRAMFDALRANSLLANLDGVVTGYLPSRSHVAFARDAVLAVQKINEDALIVCDPVLGDDPKGLYIPETAARAIADWLMPLATVATPNRFELSWLTGLPVRSSAEALAAAKALSCEAVAATSIPAPANCIETLYATRQSEARGTIKRRKSVPHGTGDLFTGLIAGGLLSENMKFDVFEHAHTILKEVVESSAGREALDLSPLTRRGAMP